MNSRLFELLDFLFTTQVEVVPITLISERFNVSERTARNYFYSLEYYLAKWNLPNLITTENSQITINRNQNNFNKLLLALDQISFYDYRLNETERLYILAMLFLTNNRPLTLTELEEQLFIGRATLQKDVQTAISRLSNWGVSFDEKKSRGYVITSRESVIRKSIFRLVSQTDNSLIQVGKDISFNLIHNYFSKLLDFRKERGSVEECVHSAEKVLGFALTDYDYRSLVINLCILKHRISQERIVENHTPKADISNTPGAKMATFILNRLDVKDEYLETEVIFLANLINRFRFQGDKRFDDKVRTDFYILVKSFVNQLSSVYGKDLLNDQKLQEYLTDHVFWLYHRAKDNLNVVNPLKEQIIKGFIKDYQIIKNNINIFEDWINIKLTEDEIVFILMHIIAGVERFTQGRKIPNVIVACDISQGTAEYLAEVVQNSFPIRIVGTSSVHNISNILSETDCDFVISTSLLDDVSIPWVQVNPILCEKDFDSIRMLLINRSIQITDYSISNSYSQDNKLLPGKNISAYLVNSDASKFTDILLPGHVMVDVDATDWVNAVLIAGEPMVRSGAVSPDYVQGMVENIQENGPYIVFAPGVAIAHASTHLGVMQTTATILRLRNPIRFGHQTNDPVKFVVALALKDPASSVGLLSSIMNIFCDVGAIKILAEAKNHTDILNILKNLEIGSMSRIINN